MISYTANTYSENAVEVLWKCSGSGCGTAVEVQGKWSGRALEVPWTCSGSAGEVQGKCRESAVDVEAEAKVEVEVEVEVKVKVKSALRATLCGGPPRVEDPATLFI